MASSHSYVKSTGVDNLALKSDWMGYEYTDYNTPANSWNNPNWQLWYDPDTYYKVTRGYNTPNFRALQRSGVLLPHTPFQQFEIEGKRSSSYDITQNSGPTHNRNYVYGHGIGCLPSEFALSELELLALLDDYDYSYHVQNAAEKIANQGHDMLTALAELHKLRTLFSGTLQKAFKIAKNIRDTWGRPKSPLKRFRNVADALAGLWLEQRYGYRTLLFDILEIEAQLSKSGKELRSRYSEHQGENDTRVEVTIGSKITAAYTSVYTTTDLVEVGIRGSVTADISVANFQFNPVQTAWELVPYSFVVDWFWSVGKALGAVTFLLANREYSSSGGLSIEVIRERRTETSFQPGYSGSHYRDADSVSKLVKRVPTRVTYLPHWKVRLDVFKVLDLLALLKGVVPK